MNLRTAFTKMLGWCPGASAAALFIPDKEISERKMTTITIMTLVSFMGVVAYGVMWTPRSYSWSIDFSGSAVDDETGMCLEEVSAGLDGVYNITITFDAPNSERVRVQWFSRTDSDLLYELVYRNGSVFAHGNDEVSSTSTYTDTWGRHYRTIWKVFSTSRDVKVDIVVDYVGKDPWWPPGSRPR